MEQRQFGKYIKTIGQIYLPLVSRQYKMMTQKSTTGNIGLAIWRLKFFYETFVQGSTTVILLNFCAKNPPHRQVEKR